MRSVTASLRSRLFGFDARRRSLGTDAAAAAAVQERLDAVQYLKAKVVPVVRKMGTDKRQAFACRVSYLLEMKDGPSSSHLERLVRAHRAHKLISTGAPTTSCEVEAATVPADEHTFTHAEFPGYTDPDTSVLRMVDDKATLVQRRLKGPNGLCYMHAPTVVQYYAIWSAALKAGLKREAPGHGLLDLARHIAGSLEPLELLNYVSEDEGVPSNDLLEGILQQGSRIEPLWRKNDPLGHLRTYGPALVSQFHVYSDFLDKSAHKHYRPPPGPQHNMYGPKHSQYQGRHSMVLVGARVDGSGRRFFLLQNWWAGKQFAEVSQDYLDFCDPRIYYVVTPQTGVPAGIPTHAASTRFVELDAALEKAEDFPREGPLNGVKRW